MLAGYTRALLPFIVLVAGYVLWAGSHRAGGAFQAGSILAGAGVLWVLSHGGAGPALARGWVRLALVAGVTAFCGLGLILLPGGGAFLQWPPQAAKALIVSIESAATVSIAITLVLLFRAGLDLLIPIPGAEAGGEGGGA